jgi:hypothetical protein
MFAQTASVSASPVVFPGGPLRRPLDCARIALVPLHGQAAIDSVLHLRDEIDLSVHARAGVQQFAMLEKKETSAAS